MIAFAPVSRTAYRAALGLIIDNSEKLRLYSSRSYPELYVLPHLTLFHRFHRSMSSLLGSRMILNLRGVIMRPSGLADFDAESSVRFNSRALASSGGHSATQSVSERTGQNIEMVSLEERERGRSGYHERHDKMRVSANYS
jgi:hypothetical protein